MSKQKRLVPGYGIIADRVRLFGAVFESAAPGTAELRLGSSTGTILATLRLAAAGMVPWRSRSYGGVVIPGSLYVTANGGSVTVTYGAEAEESSPFDLPGLKAWYDLSDIATLWQDAAMTTPITTADQTILGVSDLSGQANHLTEPAMGPLYKENVQNGRSAAYFDGGRLLTTAALTGGSLAQPTFAMVVVKTGPLNPGTLVMYDGMGASNRNALWVETSDANQLYFYAGSSVDSNTPVLADTPYILSARFQGASSRLWVNGLPVVSGDAGAQVLNAIRLGRNLDLTGGWEGHIAAATFYTNLAPTAEQHNHLGDYFASRWGLPWTLVT